MWLSQGVAGRFAGWKEGQRGPTVCVGVGLGRQGKGIVVPVVGTVGELGSHLNPHNTASQGLDLLLAGSVPHLSWICFTPVVVPRTLEHALSNPCAQWP